ncbi:MAG: class I SAM-dependent methyltransferase [candidate division WS1 bacterium]|jgi:ubiquinone/menaquinone biosynthesis C-methylase UbiE|nr:class I SAM-dependent methyltransferase [candidate division WS1 bacterium]
MKPAATHGGPLFRVHYALEDLFFRARDWISPPARKLDEIGIRESWSVLDYGCGLGSYTFAAASLVGEKGRVFAADVNPARLRHVQTVAVRQGLRNVETILTDCDTGLEGESVDAVLLYDVYHGLEYPEQVLSELFRVLKPGGLLSFSDHHLQKEQVEPCLTAEGKFRLLAKGTQTYIFTRAEGARGKPAAALRTQH